MIIYSEISINMVSPRDIVWKVDEEEGNVSRADPDSYLDFSTAPSE